MSNLRQAALQALEALRSEYPAVRLYAVQALEKALAEPEQEPVAWISESENLLSWDKFYDHMKPLYTTPTPRKWVGLTESEIVELAGGDITRDERMIARAIEVKLKEKNT